MSKLKDLFSIVRRYYYTVAKVMVFALAMALVYWQMPRVAKFKFEFQKSKPWQHETLYAPFDFPIYKDDETLRREYDAVSKLVRPVFLFDDSKGEESKEGLLSDFEKQWHEGTYEKQKSRLFMLSVFDTIEASGLVEYNKVLDGIAEDGELSVVKDRVSHLVRVEDLFTMSTATEFVKSSCAVAESGVNKRLVESLLLNRLYQNVFYDEDMSKHELNAVLEAIPLTNGMVQRDELVVTEGQVVDEHVFSVLKSLEREYAGREMSFDETMKVRMSQLFLVVLVFTMFAFFLKMMYEREVFSEVRKIVMILLFMLFVIIPSFWIMEIHPSYILVMPVCLLTIMLVTFFDSRVAFVAQIFSVLLISLVVPNPFQYIFMQTMASVVAIYSLKRLNARASYFRTSFFVFLTYVFVYLAFIFLTDSTIDMGVVGLLALNALFTLLSLPLVGLMERFFGFPTVLTLLELSNTNSPLLRKLATTAPGTFQHSFQVATLCEEVLYEIGGNALLARAGALYHDIGKMNNPVYFTENQHGNFNSHNDISNVESAQIIIAHVLDGIAIAQKAKLPEQIIDFIRTHHGTRRTEYFYIMEQREHPGEEVDAADFTYHGPEPFSRETAVLMMADSIEAASRSLKDPDENNISDLVDNIIAKQMEAGQFKNTDLTLRDFEIIKKVLKKKLMSIYHVRIAYPDK